MSEMKNLCMQNMEKIMVGQGPASLQHGKDFYKYFFTMCPQLRVYFKGAENFNADDVQKSDRFEKLGHGLLLMIHILTNTFDNPEVFKEIAREVVERHKQFELPPDVWSVFFTVWVGYLETKMQVQGQHKAAWGELGKMFNNAAQEHLKKLGMPHA